MPCGRLLVRLRLYARLRTGDGPADSISPQLHVLNFEIALRRRDPNAKDYLRKVWQGVLGTAGAQSGHSRGTHPYTAGALTPTQHKGHSPLHSTAGALALCSPHMFGWGPHTRPGLTGAEAPCTRQRLPGRRVLGVSWCVHGMVGSRRCPTSRAPSRSYGRAPTTPSSAASVSSACSLSR